MMKNILGVLSVLILFLVADVNYNPVNAQSSGPQCNERSEVLKLLAAKYKESPVAAGVTNNGGLVEVLVSAKSSENPTWTIIVTTPKGVSCLVAAGEGWRDLKPNLEKLDPEA